MAPNANRGSTFDSFALGEENEAASKVAFAVAERPGKAHSPLLVCGKSGTGKTHLLNAIANELACEHTEMPVSRAAGFHVVDEILQTTQDKNPAAFIARFHNADVLIVDDIHQLQDGPNGFDVLSGAVDKALSADKQVVLSSACSVDELDASGRLCDCLTSGVVVELGQPGKGAALHDAAFLRRGRDVRPCGGQLESAQPALITGGEARQNSIRRHVSQRHGSPRHCTRAVWFSSAFSMTWAISSRG